MRNSLLALAFLVMAATSAQAEATRFCKDVGSSIFEIKGTQASLTNKGLGETDGVINIVKLKQQELPPEWVANYSDYLRVPLASGIVYDGKVQNGGFAAKIYLLTTQKDQLGRIQQVLMISLAGSPPDLVGVDVNCK